MGPRHEQEGPGHMDDAAEGHGEEGGPERHSSFIQELENRRENQNVLHKQEKLHFLTKSSV